MKKISLYILFLMALNISCQSNNKTANTKTADPDNMKIDILSINFPTDFDKTLKNLDFTIKESEFSEYLKANQTKDVDLFKLGDIELKASYKIKDIEIPNDSYISFVLDNSESNSIQTVHLRYNFIGDKKFLLAELKKQLGEPELLNKDDSINTFEKRENYIWRATKNNHSLILSQFTDGEAIGIGNVDSNQINSALIYIIDEKSMINYPNGQKVKIIERLVKRFSR